MLREGVKEYREYKDEKEKDDGSASSLRFLTRMKSRWMR